MAFDITMPQDRLAVLLKAAGRAVSGRAPQPVLQGLLLTAGEDLLTAVGYDLAMGIRSEAPAVTAEAGSVVVPYRMLSALVAALPEGAQVRLVASESGTLAIETGEGRYSVALSHDPGDFPALPTLDSAEPMALPFGVIRKALNAVVFCVSTEESKQILQGVHFVVNGQDLRLISTDGHRGSIFDLPSIAETGKESSFVVPGPAVKELLKLPLADDDLLLVSYTPAYALFDGGDTAIIAHLLAGNFPDFAKLAPKTVKTEVITDRLALVAAVERAAILANFETGGISIAYDAKTGDLSVTVANDAGSAADLVAVETGCKALDFKLAVSAKYLLDALRHVETCQVSIGFNQTAMLRIQPVGSELHRQLVATIAVKESKTGS